LFTNKYSAKLDLSEQEQFSILKASGADNFDNPDVVLKAFELGVNFALTKKLPDVQVAKLLKE
jgi:hypothetical protein